MVDTLSGDDPKGVLSHMCQKLTGGVVKKGDIVYSCNKVGEDQFQAVVTLVCIEGQEFAGEIRSTPKEAEKAAADQAVEAHTVAYLQLEDLEASRKGRKRKAGLAELVDGDPGSVDDPVSAILNAGTALAEEASEDAMAAAAEGIGAVGQEDPLVNQLVLDAVEEAAKKAKMEAALNPAMTDKVRLNSLLMRIKKGCLQKGDTVYTTTQTTSGYQATVSLSCLPGEWASAVWAGEVRPTRQAAEQSAATVALTMIEQEAELMALANAPHPKAMNSKGKGKGKGKGKFKSKWGGGCYGYGYDDYYFMGAAPPMW